jgi:mono/diheme cytochrome c family protein
MSTDAGRTLFEQKCKVCHSMYGNAVDSRAANLQLTVLDSATIAYTIKNGRKDMPGFLTMPDSEVGAITRYVLSIRK